MLRAPSLREFGGPGMIKSAARRAHNDNALDGLQMTGAVNYRFVLYWLL